MNDVKDIPFLLQILVAINSCGILYVVFYFGKLVSKQEEHEKRILLLESQSSDVQIAEINVKLSSITDNMAGLHKSLQVVQNFMLGRKLHAAIVDVDV